MKVWIGEFIYDDGDVLFAGATETRESIEEFLLVHCSSDSEIWGEDIPQWGCVDPRHSTVIADRVLVWTSSGEEGERTRCKAQYFCYDMEEEGDVTFL